MKAFLTGLGIGMGLGVLLAPDHGEVTRRKIRERLSDVIDGFGHQIDKAKDVVQEARSGPTEASGTPDQSKTDFPPKKRPSQRDAIFRKPRSH
jgi:gas vesicle protein